MAGLNMIEEEPHGRSRGAKHKKSLAMTTPLRSQSYAGQEGKNPIAKLLFDFAMRIY